SRTSVFRRAALPSLERLEDRTVPSTLFVTNLNDSGPGSLRQALTLAANPGSDRIVFTVAGTINVLSPPPAISDPLTIIDGTTAPGFSAAPVVALHGPGTGSGLLITSASNQVRGLQIDSFTNGIEVRGTAASGNLIAGNFIGTDGSGARPNDVGI